MNVEVSADITLTVCSLGIELSVIVVTSDASAEFGKVNADRFVMLFLNEDSENLYTPPHNSKYCNTNQ